MKAKIDRRELLEKAIEFYHLSAYGGDEEYKIFCKIIKILVKDEEERNSIRLKYGFPAISQYYDVRGIWFFKGRKTFDIDTRHRSAYLRYNVEEFLNPNLAKYERRILKSAINRIEREVEIESIKLGKKLEYLDKLKNDYGKDI